MKNQESRVILVYILILTYMSKDNDFDFGHLSSHSVGRLLRPARAPIKLPKKLQRLQLQPLKKEKYNQPLQKELLTH